MSEFLSLIGWSFLPNFVTGWVQTIYYGITIRAGDPKPRPGSPAYIKHRRRIHILVVSLYLLYTIYEADYELQRGGSFYGNLGVSPGATERDIKSRFRRLAALHHPDKASSTLDPDDVNTYFVHLKTASDTLLDPARRFAYERFGPGVVEWTRCTTVRDYVTRGAQALVPYYCLVVAAMYGLGLFGYLTWARYERWLVLAVLFAFELHTITRPGWPVLFHRFVDPVLRLVAPARSPYLPFQIIALARKLCFTLYVAFSQIGPLLSVDAPGSQAPSGGKRQNEETRLREGLDRLEAAVSGLDSDAVRLLEMETAPFAGDEAVLSQLRGKIKEWLVQNTIRSDPMVRDAIGQSLTRRMGVPVEDTMMKHEAG